MEYNGIFGRDTWTGHIRDNVQDISRTLKFSLNIVPYQHCLNVSKHTRRVALRLFHLYEWVGGEQIFRSTKLTVRKLLLLSLPEYEQLIEDSRFAGAQS